MFTHLSVSLKSLDMSHNLLSSLPEDLLAKVHYLRSVNFANNSISGVPGGLFRDQAERLEAVDLSHNQVWSLTKFYCSSFYEKK